jgi:prepilin-type N-terminal cleavage/methylation domain-containing protein
MRIGSAGRCPGQAGFSLPEVMIATAAGLVLCGSLLQLYSQVVSARFVMAQMQEVIDQVSLFRRLMAGVLRPALLLQAEPGVDQLLFIWHEGVGFDLPSSALRGSDVLIVQNHPLMEGAPAHAVYYIARPSGRSSALPGLYRRISRESGGYFAAEELLSGVLSMRVEVCHQSCSAQAQIQQSTFTAIRIHAQLVLAGHASPFNEVMTLAANRGVVR